MCHSLYVVREVVDGVDHARFSSSPKRSYSVVNISIYPTNHRSCLQSWAMMVKNLSLVALACSTLPYVLDQFFQVFINGLQIGVFCLISSSCRKLVRIPDCQDQVVLVQVWDVTYKLALLMAFVVPSMFAWPVGVIQRFWVFLMYFDGSSSLASQA